jgi:hypothetical protein
VFRIEIERADGQVFYRGGGTPIEWRNPEDADAVAERLWLNLAGTGDFARFSVVEQDGSVYSDWEV